MNQCRSCRSRDVHDLISLGPMPLVNNFLKKEDIFNEKLYELDLKYCKLCNLIQLGTTVPPADLYLDYQHLSSASQINLYHLDSVAEYLRQRVENSNSKRVLEIGSNDGSLLKKARKHLFVCTRSRSCRKFG